ncbi:uncharacterized protein LOC123430071 [Hordeum vulgare subsp. vulgare]|uniref:Predicted protein n=1 Tax=Hordeum vulgare subsp. vulgare TaxID=112509 RepID=F2CRB5_HORVV|nr:uncharacterized protein LOC123430071 [Hordeum vulgare subsp. vulgare]BAJ85386.1 predicted protein [Hordeum vulgare subsp. vulgare]BAJ91981.1 predicted protein [Hordeum vulgare subsp. vulgare]
MANQHRRFLHRRMPRVAPACSAAVVQRFIVNRCRSVPAIAPSASRAGGHQLLPPRLMAFPSRGRSTASSRGVRLRLAVRRRHALEGASRGRVGCGPCRRLMTASSAPSRTERRAIRVGGRGGLAEARGSWPGMPSRLRASSPDVVDRRGAAIPGLGWCDAMYRRCCQAASSAERSRVPPLVA